MAFLDSKLRKDLETAVKHARRAAETGASKALDLLAVGHHEPWGSLKPEQRRLRNRLRAHGVQLGDVRDDKRGTQSIARLTGEVAYEHWHRMLFSRYLAENDLLIEPESGQPMSMDECRELAREQGKDWIVMACTYAEAMLPEIFRRGDPVLEVSLPPETRSELEDVLKEFPREVFLATDSLGWVYQFWQAERKAKINETEGPRGADEIPAVTQLFTEDYMVDFLLDNTLGAWWAGQQLALRPELSTRESEDEIRRAVMVHGCEWRCLRFVKGGDGKWGPANGTFPEWPKRAKELKCLDPCMGSGHFVVAIFDRLVGLRMAEELIDEATAISAVIRENLFGLEIDPRCTQIGAFNLALAAWRRVGYRTLPQMNLACSGLAPNTREAEWMAIAGHDPNVQNGMARLYRLFRNAPVLGSLINPRASDDELLEAGFHELQPRLEKILAQEARDDATHEMAVTARGLAKAAEILGHQFTLVATNVPYLGDRKQNEILKDYSQRIHPDAKADLATCFVERCLSFCVSGGSAALVTPQNWLFLHNYRKLRERLLEREQWNAVIMLGEHAFDSPSAAGAFVALLLLTRRKPSAVDTFAGIDASSATSPVAKADLIREGELRHVKQSSQLVNPDARITFSLSKGFDLLELFAECPQGIKTGDDDLWRRFFWELPAVVDGWEFYQSTVDEPEIFAGREHILDWRTGGIGMVRPRAQNRAVGKFGVAVSQMRELAPTLYTGERFDSNVAPLVPADPNHVLPLWAFCSSPDFHEAVRRIDRKVSVTNATLTKVPFDLTHWEKVAAERYPHGLPKPSSNNPTQWLFDGLPTESRHPLQVAVARLLGYRWPRQTGSSLPDCAALDRDGLEDFADKDGIVCLSATKGEAPAADRLNALLAAAFRSQWSVTKARDLIATADSKAKSLTEWLSEDFFEQHCHVFHQCPFIWHIWDGLREGFNVLVNYHRLVAVKGAGKRTLEKIIYTYLGDWIDLQRKAQANGQEGADARLIAAEHLRVQLETILAGEPPFDLFARWKPLHQQPVGWDPDVNDGVRINIRPFITAKPLNARGKNASILRVTPKISWGRSKGTEPHRSKKDFPWLWGWADGKVDFMGGENFDGIRWNDCHYSNVTKQSARESRKQEKA